MRKTLLLFPIMLLILLIGFGQNKTSNKREQKNSAEQTLMRLEREIADADIRRDVKALDRLLTDDFTCISPTGVIETKQDEFAYLETIAGLTVSLEEMKVRIYGNAAVVIGIETVEVKREGKAVTQRLRFTDTFVKQGARWRLAATQQAELKEK